MFNLGIRGQLSPTNIIGFFVLLLIFGAIIVPIVTTVNSTAAAVDPTTATIINLIPLFLAIGLVITLFTYAQPHYSQGG